MILTILGLFILIFPYSLILSFTDKRLAFAYISAFLMGLHLLIGLLSQLFGIFTYPVVLSCHVLVFVFVLVILFKRRTHLKVSIKGNWLVLLGLMIACFHLYSVHYHYTGKITESKIGGYQEVTDMRYVYPYYADEWTAITLIKDSITKTKTST